MFEFATYEQRLDDWADRLAEQLSKGRVWLRGPTGSGRRSVIHRLARRHGVLAIEVPSLGDLDAALHALVQGALHGGCIDDIIDHPKRSLLDQAATVGAMIAQRKLALALLLSTSWSDRRAPEDIDASRRRLADVLRGLTKNDGLRIMVVTGLDSAPPTGFEAVPPHTLEAPEVVGSHIQALALEGIFRKAAERVATWMTKNKVSATPVEVRLQVGIVALGGELADGKLEGLAHRLAETLQPKPTLTTAVRRLLVARRALPPAEVVRVSGVQQELVPLLTSCIGYGHEEVRVPERTRDVLMVHLRAHNTELEAAHVALANFHESHDGALTPKHLDADHAVHWLEKVHHLAWGGEATRASWERQQLIGREQYWERARYLSRELHRYQDAAVLYHRCITTFGQDSYSVHYEAFNLDRAGRPKNIARDGYAKAVQLDPDNTWWNSRWITFLIANGTLAEAELAWRNALQRIDPTGDWMAQSPWLALHLHRWVCRRWLALGYVQQARNVLNEIDPRWLDSEQELAMLRILVADHEEALRLGEAVYPAEVPQAERWEKPRELDSRTAKRNILLRWWPGRVIEAHPDEVTVVVADPHKKLAQQLTFSAEEWRQAANQPPEDAFGFFELGEYVGGERIIRRTRALGSSLLDEEYEILISEMRP